VVSFSLSCFCNSSTSSDIFVTSLAMASRFALSMARSRLGPRTGMGSGGCGDANGGEDCCPCCAAQTAVDAASESEAPIKALRDGYMASFPDVLWEHTHLCGFE